MRTTELTVTLRRPHAQQQSFLGSQAKRKVIRAGRRGGKTTGMGILAVQQFLAGHRVLYAVPTQDQLTAFWWEIKHALAEPIDAGLFAKNETLHSIELPSTKQRIRGKTAWNADNLRGDACSLLILDEYQLMNEDAWGLVGAPMMLDTNGDAVFIYTPPSFRTASVSKAHDPRHAAKLFKQAQADPSGRWETFHFTSHDNPYLNQIALEEITQDMTNLAYRQEILAEDIEDVPGALWSRELLERQRVQHAPELKRIVVGLDPGYDAGIVVAGLGADGMGYVLEDLSISGVPDVWAGQAIAGFHKYHANFLVAERNHGADMVKNTLHHVDRAVNVKEVWASHGKYARAEPISVLYEQGKVWHVGRLEALEDELCLAGDTQIATSQGFQRLDTIRAGVHVLTRQGYKPVLWSGQTHACAKVIRIKTMAGRHLVATYRHPVYTQEHGFVLCEELSSGETLETICRESTNNTISTDHLLYGMAAGGLSTRRDTTWTGAASCCIEKFGNRSMVLSPQTLTSTTLMQTAKTLPLKISLPSNAAHMFPSIPEKGLRSGHDPNGKRNCSTIGKIPWYMSESALDAARAFLPPLQTANFVEFHVGDDTIVSIEAIKTPLPVYNLHVADAQEYYANGILVHNCTWLPGGNMPSPNRLDSCVWALTELMPADRARAGAWGR